MNRIAQVNTMLALPAGTEWGAVAEADLADADTHRGRSACSRPAPENQKLWSARAGRGA